MIVEQFAGPGGWSTGAALLSLPERIGYEFDTEACRTARLNGHPRRQIDVAHVPCDELRAMREQCEGLITSPPCQAYSAAGAGGGRHDADRIADHLARVLDAGQWADYRDWDDAVPDLFGGFAEDTSTWTDPRSALVLEAVRWQMALQPPWVAAEQVPAVLPFYEQWGDGLRAQGYSVWVGVLSAEQYGVPQTRRRAILIASREREVHEPEPTHRRYSPKGGNVEGDEHLPQWLSMAQVLGWGMTARPYPTVAAGTGAGGQDPSMVGGSGARAAIAREREAGRWVYRNAHAVGDVRWVLQGNQRSELADGTMSDYQQRDVEAPAQTVTGNARLWKLRPSFSDQGSKKPHPRDLDQPAPTITAKGGNYDWVHERPATTVAGDPRIWPPGHKVNQADRDRLGAELADALYGDRAGTEAIKVSVAQAAALQSFPRGYRFVGSDTAQFRQVGDAVPPMLAVAVLGVATGRESLAREICARSLAYL